MAEIKLFSNPKFGNVRTAIAEDGTILFCLSDVAKALGYKSPADAVSTHCKKGVCVLPTPTQNQWGTTVMQDMKYGAEGCLYRLTLKSQLPDAEEFQDWVCDDVLPTIRKTGQYSLSLPSYQISDPIKRAEKWIEEEKVRQQLALDNKIMKPKADYFDALVDRNMLTNLRDTAKQIHLTQSKFISLLLENKFVYRDSKNKLKPYAEYTPLYFEMKDFNKNGHAGTQLLVNPKGKETFRLMWGGSQYDN